MPDKIVFSGNGSRVIRFFTDDKDTLEKFTKHIFEKVYGEEYNSNDLDIILNNNNPKEATCKGGFFDNGNLTFGNIFKKNIVLHSNGTDALIENKEGIDYNTQDSYEAIDKEYINKTVDENRKFLDFFFDLLPFFNQEGYKLNDDSIAIAKNICYKRLDVYAENGWRQKKQEINNSDKIQETLFFYPLVGMLNQLIDAIYKNQKQ